ncbi:Cof-type HAD-IIB family hydrolase [Anoxybacillus suryakundensis]|uniref:HAD-superfamily hydrolase, subfamily IIB n=1 Tax=Anoxybacillus suryakundensis TaxID=1325335 RepID=A0A0K6GKJ3_9BACL|nr:Cof-type HAD-IIB family hydrolase [Anoxybacillus suryakundensis]CUA79036.1 HAD-superfamily hydrolase, subfamily IIB [Anoxybacillus suryakundensis]
MIQLIVTDLDGTLLGYDRRVKTEDREAVVRAITNGIDFAVASGRMDNEILEVLKEIGHDAHRISQNGAFVYTKNHHLLHHSSFHPDIARSIYKQARTLEAVVLVCNEQTSFVETKTEQIEQMRSRLFFDIVEKGDMLEAIGRDIFPSKITVIGEEHVVLHFERFVRETWAQHVDTFISEPRCLDIMPKQISKGEALRLLMNHLQLNVEEVACFGDSFNDIPMFRLTPHSFVMSHAPEQVKKEARYVVSSVHEAIETVLSINEKMPQT